MRETYEGKVAVVTGAADGMGLGLCRRLAELGAYVVLGDINGEKLAAEAARICQEHPGQHHILRALGELPLGRMIDARLLHGEITMNPPDARTLP